MNPSFRQATRSDLRGLYVLWREAFSEDLEAKTFLSLALARTYCLIAERQGETVAMAFGFDLGWRNERYRYLYALAVSSDMRGQGVGTALMNAYEADARRDGHAGVIAVIAPGGPWGFYLRLRYSPLPNRRRRFPDEAAAPSVSYSDVFLSVSRAFGEEADVYRPDPDGVPYGVFKRFDGTSPDELPFLTLTLE